MMIPYDITVDYEGTAVVKRLFLKGDNSILQGLITNALSGDTDTLKLSSWSCLPRAVPFYLTEYEITVDAACKIELGVIKSDSTFVPLFATYSSEAAAGGVVHRPGMNGPFFPEDTGIAASVVTWAAAVRVTGAANGSIHIAGSIGVYPRGV